jgi:hypothetical protein
MRLAHAHSFSLLAALTFINLACVDPGLDSDELDSFRGGQGRVETLPASSGGGMWINNGLDDPNVSGIDPTHSLMSEAGLSTTHGMLLDPDQHDTVEYLVECALPAGAVITKQVGADLLEFEGAIGLAPEWADDACDEDCQEWVSACLLARTNVSGLTVSIWMRADHPAIGEGSSLLYPTYEASFFGNLFEDPLSEHYCQGVVLGPLLGQLEGRTCAGLLGASCGFTKYTGCQLQKRCTFPKLNFLGLPIGDSPKHCIVGTIAGADHHHTINTYVGPL